MKTIEELQASYNEKFKTLFKKIEKIESLTDNIHQLTLSIQKIAHNLEALSEQTRKNADEIDEIHKNDADRYRELIKYIIFTIVGAVIGYIINNIGVR